MPTRYLTLFLFAIFVFVTAFASVIRDGSLNAESRDGNITIRWMSEDESNVSRFVLERKAGVNGAFMTLTEMLPRGNNSSYQFVDESAFRATESIYQYRIKVIFSNGANPVYSGTITVSHRASDVRRTWGSIKAMFR
ncbi:MAG: hypothetical protein KF749_11190 [Bacteroidetes bacterium]|nr:hypothetical protein [Bacteroidota bacterium]MCW5896090.1 hypothetical protein [Bacteroidota bacterium]